MNTQAMALPKPLRQFYRTIRTNRPHLTKPQAKTLALWSDAILHTGTCGLTTVATYAALLLRQSQNTLQQRLREFYKDAAHKAGAQRRVYLRGRFPHPRKKTYPFKEGKSPHE
jgi:hypothetical protein